MDVTLEGKTVEVNYSGIETTHHGQYRGNKNDPICKSRKKNTFGSLNGIVTEKNVEKEPIYYVTEPVHLRQIRKIIQEENNSKKEIGDDEICHENQNESDYQNRK